MHTPVTLVFALLTTLALGAAGAQAKPSKAAPEKPAASPKAAAPAAPLMRTRTARCTLLLKGRTEYATLLHIEETKEERRKRIVEDFDYRFPGTLTESQRGNGEVEFQFVPASNLDQEGGTARLHLEDDFPSPGWAPVAMDATRLKNAGPMVFKALGRGQGIFALGGGVVNLIGKLTSLAPMTVKKSLGETENRPVASTPFPLMDGNLQKVGLPAIQFEGGSLWSWANSAQPLVVKGALVYTNQQLPSATVNGRIEITFQIGATEK